MEKKRVNCLYRVSSKQQLHGDDIPMQREECMAYIGLHSDWVFQQEYLEKAVSGFKTSVKDRDKLQEVLEDAKAGKFDILLVYMSDRIGRKEDESPIFVSTLNKLGIEVWSVKEGQLKTEEHIDKLLNYIRFWQAEGESRKTGMRVKDAQCTFAKAGKFIGGYAPYGYTLEFSGEISNHGRALKHLVIDQSKVPIIRKIYGYAVNYNYGGMKIAKLLNEEGIAGPNNEWKACTIMEILKNPIYMGYISYNRRQRSKCGGTFERTPMEDWILSENQIPELAIISKEIWYKAQEMRENRKSKIKDRRDEGYGKYPISTTGTLSLMGLAYCGYCGCRLTNGSKYDYWTTKDGEKRKKIVGRYRCTNKANGSLTCEGKAFYRSEEIEPIIHSVVTSYLESLKQYDIYDDILALQEEQRLKLKKEKEQVQKEIKAIQKDIDTLQEYIPSALRGEGVFSVEKLSAMISSKESKLVELQATFETLEKEYKQSQISKKDMKDIGHIISNWGELFNSCSVPEKKVMLAKLIERIDIWENDIKIKFKISLEDFEPRISSEFDKEGTEEIKGNQKEICSDSDRIPYIRDLR